MMMMMMMAVLPNEPWVTSFFLSTVLFCYPEKKRYRESYISDDLDLDPQGSDGSPRLSRRSTSSSGIEADTRQRSVSVEMTSMDEEGLRQTEEKSFSSAASLGSSHTSGVDTGSKARADEDEWQEEGELNYIFA